MKRVIIICLAAFVSFASINAQGSKSLKEASKEISKALSNPLGAAEGIAKAKILLEEAFKDEEVAAEAKSWVTRGDILHDVAEAQINARLIDPSAALPEAATASGAIDAYIKAYELADADNDKRSKKNAIAGLKKAEQTASNIGITLYQESDFSGSYINFAAELTASDLLKRMGEESRLDAEGLYTERNYFAGLTAYYAEEYPEALAYMEKAIETGTSEATVYQLLFEGNNKIEKEEKAKEYLDKGRSLFPDDSGLLFSEINYYLAKGELNTMISKLEEAYSREPENASILLTLGQVYDQLHVKAKEADNAEEATKYFDGSLKYYKEALAADENNFDVNYALGALYYNKAASFTNALNDAANDFTAAGTTKYDLIKAEMSENFNEALPYFLKADEADGKDRNTLIALKEIMVRTDKFDKSNEYKERLESLEE
ncbi:MAG: tetratricopeptide (TPR) repeat protein [Saprospiraceae bacterium]|jgi:tetratricopeptide (TPR) repeat protein